MNLRHALEGIKARTYFEMCNLKYTGLSHHGFGELEYGELPPTMQLGIKRLLLAIHRTQKIVFYYEIEYVVAEIKKCGIQLRWFFDRCNVPGPFLNNKYLSKNIMGESLISIRMELLNVASRLFDYMNPPGPGQPNNPFALDEDDIIIKLCNEIQ